MIATDVPTVLLVIGVLALVVTTALSSLAIPTLTFTRRRRPRPQMAQPAIPRRVVTGRPAALPPLALPPAPRQDPISTDDRPSATHVRDAETLIEHLVEHDPERLADMLTRWINSDPPLDDRTPR